MAKRLSYNGALLYIKELEGGSPEEERHGVVDNAFIDRVDTKDLPGEYEEHNGGERHEDGTGGNGSVAGASCGQWVAGSNCVAHADGGGAGDAERNHVSESGMVEGNFVSSKGDGRKASGKGSGCSEDGDLEKDMTGGWEAETEESLNAVPVGGIPAEELRGFV